MLTSKRKTAIVEEQVMQMLQRVKSRADAYNQDGAMMGDVHMPGPARLDAYWQMTPDLSDVPLLTDPNWEDRIRQGLDVPPKNPYWINLLRVPGLLKKTAADFVRLNVTWGDRYQGGGSEVPSSPGPPPTALTAGGGVPLPMEAAAGSPQPSAGGYPGSANPYQPGVT